MLQIVVDLLLANYISPKYQEDWKGFVKKVYDKYPEVFKANTKQAKHLREFYLNDDPRMLGGHCCPLPGQPGSNNGGEKRGGLIQDQWRVITRYLRAEEKKNPIYAMIACALDLQSMTQVSDFAIEPTKLMSDYDILRKVNTWDTTPSGAVASDVLFMVCLDSDKKLLDTSKAIGNDNFLI